MVASIPMILQPSDHLLKFGLFEVSPAVQKSRGNNKRRSVKGNFVMTPTSKCRVADHYQSVTFTGWILTDETGISDRHGQNSDCPLK
jgi:hypothetical protein